MVSDWFQLKTIKVFLIGLFKCARERLNVRRVSVFNGTHPRRPRGSQSGQEKRRDERFLVWAKEPLGTDSHRTISKNSNGCRLLIEHKKTFVLLCPISEQHLLSSFRVFVHDGYCLALLVWFVYRSCACNSRSIKAFKKGVLYHGEYCNR